MAIHIHTLNGGDITITTGGSTPPPPTEHPETRFTLQDGTVEEYDIEGTLDFQWMADNEFVDVNEQVWLKTITAVDIGVGSQEHPLTSIGEGTFMGCRGLTNLTIPDSVTSIEDQAFYGCSGLTSVTIGSGVTYIGWETFAVCSGLTSMTFNNFDVSTTKTEITKSYILGTDFYDENWNRIEKTIRVNCTDGSFDMTFGTDSSITFTDL